MEVLIFDHMNECTEAEVQRMLPLVSEQRRQQALRYKHTFGQFCCLMSWIMLFEQVEMSRYRDVEWNYNDHGKPFIEGGPYFSISHCKEAIAVAIDAHPIGIDIESIRHADDDLIVRTMNEAEQSKIKNQKSKIEGDREFTRLWTQKEAVAKMNGTGIEGFEQLQHILSKSRDFEISTIEKEKYIYTIAYGKLCSIGAEIQAADL